MVTGRSVSRAIRDWVVVRRRRRIQSLNVYKPPRSRFTPTAIPTFLHPSLHVGGFNCQHVNCGYNKTSPDGESLEPWATTNNLGLLYDPKKIVSFTSLRRNVGINPDLVFASFIQDSRLPDRHVRGKFPRSQDQPSLITPPRLKVLPTTLR